MIHPSTSYLQPQLNSQPQYQQFPQNHQFDHQIQQPARQYIQNVQQSKQLYASPQQLSKTSNQNLGNLAAENPRLAPYEIRSKLDVDFYGVSTYEQLLNNPQNDTELLKRLRTLDPNLLKEPVFLFVADIQPEDIQWQIWKHSKQLNRFLREIEPEIEAMTRYQKRRGDTGSKIIQLFSQRLKPIRIWKQEDILALVQFLNLLGNHPFLCKSVVYLTFIEHCMPMYLWNIKVYQQVPIYYDPNFITQIIHNKNEIKQFLTITGDGIIISSKNPLDTKIDQMVPFTNQFIYNSQIQDDDELYFSVSSCTHENVKVNFKKDYIGGINFHLGLARAISDSGYTQTNRFQSFSKTRKNCWSKLYNDGIGYFNDMCDELNKARKQVCITDWWMTPYFMLKRDLQRGTDIHQTTNRLDGILKKLSDRGVKIFIILFRQPLGLVCNDSYDCQLYLQSLGRNIRMRRHPITPQLWSHHEKCVIIDQRVGFMGGLDLCYGRWDTPDHHIVNVNNMWDGGDYTNERLRQYTAGNTKFFENSTVDRKCEPRMPWHDIGLQTKGDSVIDMARHFVQYWYFVDAERVKDPYNHLRNFQKRYDRAASYDYPDWENDEYDQMNKPKRGISDKFALCGTRTKLFVTGTEKRIPQLLVEARQGRRKGTQQLQLCRSASPWSIGARDYQQSIHNAYQTLIKQSEHHIYIENQFFMGTQNKIVECLADRIRRAHLNKQSFKIIVVMPLLPGFEGDISKKENAPLRVQVHNQFQSINKGEKSLQGRLFDLPNFNIDDYIFFFGLRGHAVLNGKPITEIIYVHSKLMIVDDKRAIIGSANINDRSLCGNRDSQLAMVIQENNGEVLDGMPRREGIFDLRYRLYNEHFGLTPQETGSINSPQIWAKVINNAKKNTLIYRQLFGCYPDDTITVGDEVAERQKESNPALYDQLKGQIFAHAVEFPLHFMEDEDLQLSLKSKQGLLGVDAFL